MTKFEKMTNCSKFWEASGGVRNNAVRLRRLRCLPAAWQAGPPYSALFFCSSPIAPDSRSKSTLLLLSMNQVHGKANHLPSLWIIYVIHSDRNRTSGKEDIKCYFWLKMLQAAFWPPARIGARGQTTSICWNQLSYYCSAASNCHNVESGEASGQIDNFLPRPLFDSSCSYSPHSKITFALQCPVSHFAHWFHSLIFHYL